MRKQALTYCSNVHPLQNLAVWKEKVRYFGSEVGSLLGKKPFPLGLWFNEDVLKEIRTTGIAGLHKDLNSWGVNTFTLNAFPQSDFHQPVVKKKVYVPDWTDPTRLKYTQQCAEVLAELLPENGFGSISSLPLGWREGWTQQHSEQASEALIELAKFLNGLRERTGKTIVLALEPEPGCVLERTPQVLEFWNTVLRPTAARAGVSDLADVYLGICYDTCHQAVQFEEPEVALEALHQAGIPIHKMQLSSALEFPANTAKALREQFVEPKFLHQTRIKTLQSVMDFDDLPQALAADANLLQFTWRTHYHVPVHAESLLNSAVRTTRDDMLRALRYALKHDLCGHFEVETYTWSVLPESHRPHSDVELAGCLAKELDFIRHEMPGVFNG
ncbi:MAG TPA: xylose isomerase [Fibrobacteres bacterium]|nr:xylose isomerase [Fibrobacterota bacterium]